MKNKIILFGLAVCLITAVACSEKKEAVTTQDPSAAIDAIDTTAATVDSTTAAIPTKPVAEGTDISVKGIVKEITNGKDGYMAKIYAEDGKLFTATISIPNMADPKQYRSVKVGETITVTGTTFTLGEETGIKVTTLQ